MEVAFIPTYGDYRCSFEEGNVLDLYFIVKNYRSAETESFLSDASNPKNVSFPENENITLDSISVSPTTLEKNNYRVYMFTVVFSIIETTVAADMELNSVKLNDKVFDIGNLSLQYSVKDKRPSNLRIKSQALMSPSEHLSDFTMLLLNEGKNNITITNVKTPSYSNSNVNWDGSAADICTSSAPVIFGSNEEHRLDIDFSSCSIGNYYAYYISPIIDYIEDGCSRQLFAYSYLCGLPQTEKRLIELASKLF